MKYGLRLIWTQLWLTVIVCLVLLALYTSLGRQLIPLVETLEVDVEQVLSQQLGIAVDIGSLKGDWVWFSPRIKINNVRLGDSEQGLKIQLLEAKLDVAASIFHRVPVFDQLNVGGVELPFFQDKNGNWSISQFTIASDGESFWQGEKPLWLELLGQQGEIHLYNWNVSVKTPHLEPKNIKILDVRLRNRGLYHWLDGEIQLDKSKALLKTQFEVEGDLWDFSDHNATGYLQLANQAWQPWIPDYSSAWQVETLTAGARLWVEVKDGQLENLDGYIDIPDFLLLKTIDAEAQEVGFRDGHISLAGRRDGSDWHLWFDSSVDWQSANRPPIPNGRISWLPSIAGGMQLALNNIDLAHTAAWLETFHVLPEQYMPYVTNLKPSGLVEQVRINVIPDQDWRWGISLDFVEASIQGWDGIPALNTLTAQVDLTAEKGRLITEGIDTLLHFPTLYESGWQLKNFNSDIFWQIEDDYLRLVSPELSASYQQSDIKGSFSLYVPLIEDKIEAQLNVLLGIQNFDLLDQKIFVPPAAAPEVSAWLNENIIAGQAKASSFLFSSSLESELALNSQSIQFYADINDADLTYLPAWPQVSQIKASLMVDVPNVDVWVNSAKTLGGDLVSDSAYIKVRTDSEEHTWLTVRGELIGDASEGMKYFSQTPLQQNVEGAFDYWQAQGLLSSQLYARIPLSNNTEELNIRLNSKLNNVKLDIEDLNVSFQDIQGEIEFDTHKGITARGIKAKTFSGLATADISSVKAAKGFDIKILAHGQAKTDAIKQWLPVFLFKPVTGELSYQLELDVRPVERGGIALDVRSDLVGIDIAVPLPFGKTAEQALDFEISLKRTHDLRMDFRFSDLANGVIALEDGSIERGQIFLGTTEAYLPSDNGLSIIGNLPYELDAKAWWDLWNDIKPEAEIRDGIEEKSALLTHVDITAKAVTAWQQPMGPSHIVGDYEWGQWLFDLDSELIKGKIILPDDIVNNSIQLDLEYIHMPVDESDPNKDIKFGAPETVDPLLDFDPSWIPKTDLKVAEVFIGTSNYGRWDMTMRAKEGFTRIHVNDSFTKYLTMKGDIDWYKDETGHKTHLNLLRITSKNIGDSQRAFRKVSSVEAKNSSFDANVTWQGSPAKFNYASLNGLAKINIKDGVLISDNTGALKAFGVLNFNSISRRLQLDFSDLYESGIVFDILKTRLSFENGLATFADPLWIDGPSAKFQSSGTVNFNSDAVEQKLVVTFPVTSSLPLVAVLAGLAPQIAGAIYVTEKLIGEELEQFTSASYSITGTIENPKMEIDQAFDNDIEGKESRSFKNRFLDIFGLGDD